jgi:hypothetical protein
MQGSLTTVTCALSIPTDILMILLQGSAQQADIIEMRVQADANQPLALKNLCKFYKIALTPLVFILKMLDSSDTVI